MTKYSQTKLHGNGMRGSCSRTTWACILDEPPMHFPHFEEMGRMWHRNYIVYFAVRGWYLYRDVYFPSDQEYVYAAGESPRSTEDEPLSHAVVWGDDGLVWDPHPSRKGIVGEPDCLEWLVPHDQPFEPVEEPRWFDAGHPDIDHKICI